MGERHYRSWLKGATWRLVGTLDTIVLAWLFTGSVDVALSIGGVEVFTKIILYYVHERIWGRIRIGKQARADLSVGELRSRSVIKGFSWRLWGTLDTILIALLITGDGTKALSIGFAEVFTKVFLFYLHERSWQRVRWGRSMQSPAPSGGVAPQRV